MLSRLLSRVRTACTHPSRAALVLPAAVVLGGGLILISLVLLVSAWEERNDQRVAATRLVDDALAVRALDLASRARDHADRDDALVHPGRQRGPSSGAADPGARARHPAGIDLVLVLDPDGRAVDVSLDGHPRAPSGEGLMVDGLQPLLRAARQHGEDRPPAGLVRVNGMPALVAVAPIGHHAGMASGEPMPASLLVLGQRLDPAFLAEFGRRYHLHGLQLVAADQAEPPVALPLRLADGSVVGRLTWAVDSSIGRFLHVAAPLLLTTFTGLIILALLVVRQTRNAAARIAASERLAFQDPLTGLPNRRLFLDRLEAALAERGAASLPVAVLYLDLDGFKPVNDSLGHVTGDRLLQMVAGRLLDSVRASDTVARLGGDEFAILLPHLQRPEEVGEIAHRLQASFVEPLLVEDRPVEIGVSVGAAWVPQDGVTAEMLLRAADAAMYRMKATRRRRVAQQPRPVTSMAA